MWKQCKENFALRKTAYTEVCLRDADTEGTYEVEYSVFRICLNRSRSALLGNIKDALTLFLNYLWGCMLCMTGSLTTSSSCQCVSLPGLPGDGLVFPFPVVQNCTQGRKSQGYKMLMIIAPGSGSHTCFPTSFNTYYAVSYPSELC